MAADPAVRAHDEILGPVPGPADVGKTVELSPESPKHLEEREPCGELYPLWVQKGMGLTKNVGSSK
jgi:hypothetical protein